MTCLPQGMVLSITCAPCGTGKVPIGASTRIISARLAATGVVCDGDGVGEAGVEGDAVGEDAVWLAVGEGDSAGLAVVIPAEQAVTDRPAAQIVMAMAMRRCMFN